MMGNKTTVYDCSIIELDRHHSNRKGNLSVVENSATVPFAVRRVYYLYDVPGGEGRGAHAHRDLDQFMVAASGSFSVTLDDGEIRRTVVLNRPYVGLYIPAGIWARMDDFSSGAICLVLASDRYDEADYLRDYQEFKAWKREH